jgi:hypothetical protein
VKIFCPFYQVELFLSQKMDKAVSLIPDPTLQGLTAAGLAASYAANLVQNAAGQLGPPVPEQIQALGGG